MQQIHTCLLLIVWTYLSTLSVFSQSAFAQSNEPKERYKERAAIVLHDEREVYSLTSSFDVLVEFGSPLDIEAVKDRTTQFEPLSSALSNPDFPEHSFWLRTRVQNLTVASEWVLTIHSVHTRPGSLYLCDSEEEVLSNTTQDAARQDTHRLPTYYFAVSDDKPFYIYIRIEDQLWNRYVPVTLETIKSHVEHTELDNNYIGAMYAALIILLTISILLFFATWQKDFATQLVYVAAVFGMQLSASGHIFKLFPGDVANFLAGNTQLLFLLATLACGAATYQFFVVKRLVFGSPIWITCSLVCFSIALLAVFIDYPGRNWNYIFSYAFGSVILANCALASAEAFIKGMRSASYLIVGWIFMACGALPATLVYLQSIPMDISASYSLQFGFIAHSVLFICALVVKNIIQLGEEVALAHNDLSNNMLVIEEQNVRLELAKNDAVKASNVKSQFLANVSHEIRTPLNAIIGFCRELASSQVHSQQKEQVGIINSAANSLLAIVNDVLDFSKIEAGKLTLNNLPYSPLQMVESTAGMMAKSAHVKELHFILETNRLPATLVGDEPRLRQVLINLIGNAIKFTPGGFIKLCVNYQHKQGNQGKLSFHVQDTGIGINDDDRNKLFSAFSQIDDALNRTYQGTGLGLVISQELINLMGGDLSFTSEKDKGSTFSFCIPTVELENSNEKPFDQLWQGKSVLIIDSELQTNAATCAMLNLLGASVQALTNVEEASESGEHFDYIFVALPPRQNYNHEQTLRMAARLHATHKIVLFGTTDPLLGSPDLRASYLTSIRMPTTISALRKILSLNPETSFHHRATLSEKCPELHVLAVDDIPENLLLLETWLKNSKVSLELAYNAEQAIKACELQDFDIILMDIQMPNIDGIAATQRIRKIQRNIGTPIIALTAHAFKEEQDKLLASGLDDCLSKPLAFEDLIEVFERWCDFGETSAPVYEVMDLPHTSQNDHEEKLARREMLRKFVLSLAATKRELEQAMDAGDHQSLLETAHKVYGTSCYVGAPQIQHYSNQLELTLKNNELQEVQKLVKSLVNAIDAFRTEAQNIVMEDMEQA